MSRSGLVWGTVFVLVGAFALLADAGVWWARSDWMWPVLLLGVGAALLVGGLLPAGGSGHDDR